MMQETGPSAVVGWMAARNERLQLRLQLQRACVVTERGGVGAGTTCGRREALACVHLGALVDPGTVGLGKVRLNQASPDQALRLSIETLGTRS